MHYSPVPPKLLQRDLPQTLHKAGDNFILIFMCKVIHHENNIMLTLRKSELELWLYFLFLENGNSITGESLRYSRSQH